MFKTIQLIVLATLCLNFNSKAQSQTNDIKPLKIGDTIPEVVWNMPLQVVNHPEGKTVITLNDYKGKLIILDFWATWCGACIEAFPKMHQLQQQFQNQVKVLLVNSKTSGDNEVKVSKYLEKRESRTGQTVRLPYLLEDTVFSSLFPYRYIPHYVWLKDRQVIAITSSKEVTALNLSKLIADKTSVLHRKNDLIDFDAKKPLYFTQNKHIENSIRSSSIIGEYIEGIGIQDGKDLDSNGKVTRLYLFNLPLMSLLRKAYRNELNRPNNQIFFQLSSPVILTEDNKDYTNLFCYERYTPPISIDSALFNMQQDLYRYFNTKVVLEKRLMTVWLVKNNNKANLIKTRNEKPALEIDKNSLNKFIQNKSVTSLIKLLNTISTIPVMDKTSFGFNIDLKLPNTIYQDNMEAISKYLAGYGFEIIQSSYEMTVAVVKN